MEKLLGSIADLTRLPAALFIIDTVKEHIAVSEARKLNIPTIAICDTNTDPTAIDFPIPANDDATKSISLIMDVMVKAIEEGLAERKTDKEMEREKEVAAEEEAGEAKKFEMVDAADEEEGEGAKTEKPAGTRPRKTTTRKK
jgi:small subunit ribosomal protein S2